MKEWRVIVTAALFMLFAFGFIVWMGEARGEEAAKCDYPESLLTEALAQEPDRLVVKLEGKFMEAFLSKMEAAGYLSGSLPNVVSIYIIKGKLLPGHHEAIDILFFIDNQGCIVGKVYGTASIVEAML